MKYRKKPVVVEAVQYDGSNQQEIKDKFQNINLWGTVISNIGTSKVDFENLLAHECFIVTLEGNMKVCIADWIIKGINGEFYPVKPDIFEKTYEKVED